MHLFHPVKGIRKYASAEEILVDFVEIRLDAYKRRKAHMVKTMTAECELLRNKARFIKMVVEDEIIIFKRKKAQIESDLVKHKFLKVDDSYDYLMNVKTYQYTEESIDKMLSEVRETETRLAQIQKTTVVDMWKTDIIKC